MDDIIVLNTELMQMKRMCQILQMGFEKDDGTGDRHIEISKQKQIDRNIEKILSCVYDTEEEFLDTQKQSYTVINNYQIVADKNIVVVAVLKENS